jgi:hypothetical protein
VFRKKEGPLLWGIPLVGLLVWVGVSIYSGEEEAWDSNAFFIIGLPTMMLASAVAGYIEPNRAWRWGLGAVCLQPVALLLSGRIGPLLIVGILTFGVIAALCVGMAYLGVDLQRMMQRTQPHQ